MSLYGDLPAPATQQPALRNSQNDSVESIQTKADVSAATASAKSSLAPSTPAVSSAHSEWQKSELEAPRMLIPQRLVQREKPAQISQEAKVRMLQNARAKIVHKQLKKNQHQERLTTPSSAVNADAVSENRNVKPQMERPVLNPSGDQRHDDDADDNEEEIVEEYDPAHPNEYEALVKMRRRLRNQVQRERSERTEQEAVSEAELRMSGENAYQRRLQMSGTSTTAVATPEPTAISGEDAYQRRLRMSGLQEPEPEQQPEEEPEPQDSQSGGVAVAKRSVVDRLMDKMGWKKGQGLGASNQGIKRPLTAKKSTVGHMVIQEARSRKRHRQGDSDRGDGSNVLLLLNMVGRGEVDDDLEEETADECSRFGRVERCIVHEIPATQSVPDHEAVRIFIQFDSVDSAKAAMEALNGRLFGGRSVRALSYEESRFTNGDLLYLPPQ